MAVIFGMVMLKNGGTGYMVAAVLSEAEVKQYGIVLNHLR